MSRATLALVLCVIWGLTAFGLRMLIQLRRTGDSGFRAQTTEFGSAEWWARVLFIGALALSLAAPIADMAGLSRFDALDSPAVAVFGTVLAVIGIVITLWAQLGMGDSWRIGVDDTERTDLVTGGLFQYVRNPIFTTMSATAVGLALLVPNAVAFAGLVVLVVALELQVRVVEEPYLRSVHGESFVRYTSRVGRFLPGVGRTAS
jgi:protein-S-isoprenylcysteine O-methyltransferase Ste14